VADFLEGLRGNYGRSRLNEHPSTSNRYRRLLQAKRRRRLGTARDLYQSRLFRLSRAYAEAFCDDWRILSAEHNVVKPDQVIAPYDRSLLSMSKAERRDWRTSAPADLHYTWPHGSARFVLLGGAAYARRWTTWHTSRSL